MLDLVDGHGPYAKSSAKQLRTRDVRNELLIVLYLDIHVGHDKTNIHLYTYIGLFKVYTTAYKCTR